MSAAKVLLRAKALIAEDALVASPEETPCASSVEAAVARACQDAG